MKYLSLFSGIGGFELGIKRAYEKNNRNQSEKGSKGKRHRDDPAEEPEFDSMPVCIGFSEVDKYAIQIYQKHFNHRNYGDITKIKEKELPDFDFLCGGFPCQSFSIAGKRGGFADTRGTLFFDIARILKFKQPRFLLLENVKGLLSHDEGRTFTTIIATLDELGYDLQWQVLNSKDFGVPQNRERIFIVGNLRGVARPKVFPFGEGNSIPEAPRGKEGKKLANTLRAKLGGPDLENSYMIQRGRGKNTGGVHAISPTLSANSFQDNNHVDGIRRLTPIECERLQGFPDGWTEGVSDTQRYKCLGNAVTVNVIQAIYEKLRNQTR